MSWAQWWNYLRRQLFVMDTYSSPANARLNHAMLGLHAYLSAALLLALGCGAPALNHKHLSGFDGVGG